MAEREALGLTVSGHPVDRYAPELAALTRGRSPEGPIMRLADLDTTIPEALPQRIRLAVCVRDARERVSQKTGNRFAFISLDDPTGTREILAGSRALESYRNALKTKRPLMLACVVRPEGSRVTLFLDSAADLELTVSDKTRELRGVGLEVELEPGYAYESAVRQALARYRSADAEGRLTIRVRGAGGEGGRVFVSAEGYRIPPEAAAQVRAMPGVLKAVQVGAPSVSMTRAAAVPPDGDEARPRSGA